MRFKIWFEGIEEYQPFRNLISTKAQNRNFAFDKWFPEERIYLPFSKSEENKDLEKQLNAAFEEYGYYVSDLKNGYAQKKDNKNIFRIGKLINDIQKTDLKKIKSEFENKSISLSKYNDEIRMYNNYWNDLRNDFNTRGTSSDLLVVISKNIHDIGSMSTGRGWESCMTLGKGSQHKNVYCEVQYGGFIAYLIKNNDKNIESPIARIHIRRFDNKKGDSIAIPEETIYGEDTPEFLDIVKSWLNSKQGAIKPGPYTRMGGKYSDTWGSEKGAFVPPETKDVTTIISWLNKWMDFNKEKRKKYYKYFLNAIQSYFQSNEDFPEEFVLDLKGFLFSNQSFFAGHGSFSQTTEQFLPAFAAKNPKLINKEEFEKAFKVAAWFQKPMLSKLINAFPQYATKELFDSINDDKVKDSLSKINTEFQSYYKDQIAREASEKININNPEFAATDSRLIYIVYSNVHDEIKKLEAFKPIPENLIKLVIDFSKNVDKLKLLPERKASSDLVRDADVATSEQIKNDIISHVVFTLGITSSDTPTVQRFYQSLFPKWNEIGGVGVLGWAIARLGENGIQFLPFIEEKKKKLESMADKIESLYKNQYEAALESYDYIIDAIKNRTGYSSKYKMSHGKGIEYRLSNEERMQAKNKLRDAIVSHRF
jgi:hypothetical protein